MNTTKKIAYYQTYDPSVLEMSEYCIREDMCNDIGNLEDTLFAFGQDMIRLSKNLDSLDKQEIAAKIQAIVNKHCRDYLENNDSIANLDEYDGLEEYEDEEDDSEDEDDGEEYEGDEEES